jgi:DNA-directed RNA polymerase specialized sigma24 family protein
LRLGLPLTSADIARLYRQEARRMVGFFVRRTYDPETALDLVAETFASAGIERPPAGEGELERLVELAGLEAARARVADGLARLPDDQQRAVELRVVREASYEEIARIMGITQQAARARVSRGLRTLAAMLDGPVALREVSGHD